MKKFFYIIWKLLGRRWLRISVSEVTFIGLNGQCVRVFVHTVSCRIRTSVQCFIGLFVVCEWMFLVSQINGTWPELKLIHSQEHLYGLSTSTVFLNISSQKCITPAVKKNRLKRHKTTENIQLLEILTQGVINAHCLHKPELEEPESAAESWN